MGRSSIQHAQHSAPITSGQLQTPFRLAGLSPGVSPGHSELLQKLLTVPLLPAAALRVVLEEVGTPASP